jgi:hypothetical protein
MVPRKRKPQIVSLESSQTSKGKFRHTRVSETASGRVEFKTTLSNIQGEKAAFTETEHHEYGNGDMLDEAQEETWHHFLGDRSHSNNEKDTQANQGQKVRIVTTILGQQCT